MSLVPVYLASNTQFYGGGVLLSADTAQQQEVAAKKQVLRDITSHPAIAAAVSTAELRALTLDALLTV